MEVNKVVTLNNASIYHVGDPRARAARPGKIPKGSELVLTGVSLEIERGQLVYFIGKVGSGKSTLLKTLYAEVPLAEGSGFIAGYDLSKIKKKDIPHLRRRIGIVFQDYRLLTDRNVFQNLHYVLKATGWKNETDIRRRIDEVLNMVRLEHKLYKMPFQLSGGQQQRLSIARALLNNPEIILADEPTGNLDPAAAAEVMSIFSEIVAGGCPIVMSTHNIANIEEHPSRTIRFAQGKIEEIDLRSMMEPKNHTV